MKGTTAKVANLPQFLQSSHSPTAIPRILEENQSSLRGDTIAQAFHTNAQKLDSSIEEMDCHADKSARNDDENAQIPNKLAKDSRINKNAQNVFSPNADRRQDLGDKNGALQEQTWAHTRAYVTADSPQQNKGYRSALADVSLESPFLAPKPTPKNKKLSYNEQRELATLPERIQSLEAQKQLIEQRLSDETSLARYGVVALASELESIAKELDSSYERYFFLEEKQESLKR